MMTNRGTAARLIVCVKAGEANKIRSSEAN
jgi:hypothetical protein